MKFFAILLVITGHYFHEEYAQFHFLHSIGYFGAATFAFLSGYGVFLSYSKNGIPNLGKWLLRKIKNIYVPFLLVCIFQTFFIYKDSSNNIFERIFLGADDGTLWYILFILGFNALFGILFHKSEGIFSWILLFSCGLAWIILAQSISLGSQWYASTGALLLGVVIAKKENKFSDQHTVFLIIISIVILLFVVIINLKMRNNMQIKDWTTILSGMLFVYILYLFNNNVMIRSNVAIFIGSQSLWIYIIHMKILRFINTQSVDMYLPFIAMTLFISCLIGYLYSRLKMSIHHESIRN